MEATEVAANQVKEGSFRAPYCNAIFEEFSKKVPEKKDALATVFGEFDKQAVGNFGSFESTIHTGVMFSFTKVSVTPELIKRLSDSSSGTSIVDNQSAANIEQPEEEGREEGVDASRQNYYLFTAFGVPPGSNAFTVSDIGLDRFIRLMPRVARAVRAGEVPPEINIYLLGSPYGFGGKVTQEWIDSLGKNGFAEEGRMYAEFIEKHESTGDRGKKHIVLQGKSKGAIIADETSKLLSPELQNITQRLLDSPAGHHNPNTIMRWFKGAQVAIGLSAETIFHLLSDDLLKSVAKQDAPFLAWLSKAAKIAEDDPVQKSLKKKAAFAEGWLTIKGSPLDTEKNRSFIRQGLLDPLTFSPKRWLLTWGKRLFNKNKYFFHDEGRALQASYNSGHFSLHKRFDRWKTILDFCQNPNKISKPDWLKSNPPKA